MPRCPRDRWSRCRTRARAAHRGSRDEPIAEDMGLEDLSYEVTEGHCVLRSYQAKEKILTGAQAAKELYKAGSSPDFFQLDDSGNSIDF